MKPPVRQVLRQHLPFEDYVNLDIAERRLPQDGRIKMKWAEAKKWTSVSVFCSDVGGEDRHATSRQIKPSA